MSRLHFKDLLRITKGTPQKLFVVKRAARDGQQWWEKTFTKAIAAQPASFTTQQINAKDYLGCKFWRNSGWNSQIPFRFGDFAPGTTEFTI
jgi:hypothetical protein